MKEEVFVATSPKQAKALRAQGVQNVVRMSFNHTEITVPAVGGTTVLWRPFTTRKQRQCARAYRAVIEAHRSTAM